jgi:hypothetical protein
VVFLLLAHATLIVYKILKDIKTRVCLFVYYVLLLYCWFESKEQTLFVHTCKHKHLHPCKKISQEKYLRLDSVDSSNVDSSNVVLYTEYHTAGVCV